MKSAHKVKISVGVTTILMIFVVLCFTTFAVLSFLTARSDYALTRKTVTATQEYYQADAKIEELLASIDEYLSLASKSAVSYVKTNTVTNLPIGQLSQDIQDTAKQIISNPSFTEAQKVNAIYYCFADLVVQKYPNVVVKTEASNRKVLSYIEKVNDNYQIQVQLLLLDSDDVTQRYQVKTRKLVSTKQWKQETIEVWHE